METCDVLIVGGGPAGSTCAWKLREAGLDVLLMDKQLFPRDKTCAGWITPQVVETLQLDVHEYGQQRVWQPITGFRTGMIGGPDVRTEYDRVISYGIRRCEFDHYLLERAMVRRRLGAAMKRLERKSDRWIVNGSISTPLVVGAGGHFCPVARWLETNSTGSDGTPQGLSSSPGQKASVVAAQEVEFRLTDECLVHVNVEAQTPELFFCEDLRGYGWCFRKGDYLNVGLGRIAEQNLSGRVHDFCDFLQRCGKVKCALPAPFRGHAYRLYERRLPRLFGNGVLLIGDAAGLAYPQSGEGIRPAVESGCIAAAVIAAAGGDYGTGRMSEYVQRIVSRFGQPRGGGAIHWLPASWLRTVATALLTTHWFSRRVVMDRWFLHTQTPALTHVD